tara:strand:- start:515 stop:1021 length:507 start_codon:yes stop_codon:yes gene_type:complete
MEPEPEPEPEPELEPLSFQKVEIIPSVQTSRLFFDSSGSSDPPVSVPPPVSGMGVVVDQGHPLSRTNSRTDGSSRRKYYSEQQKTQFRVRQKKEYKRDEQRGDKVALEGRNKREKCIAECNEKCERLHPRERAGMKYKQNRKRKQKSSKKRKYKSKKRRKKKQTKKRR